MSSKTRAPTITIDTSASRVDEGRQQDDTNSMQASHCAMMHSSNLMVNTETSFLSVPESRDALSGKSPGGSLGQSPRPHTNVDETRFKPINETDFEVPNNSFTFTCGQLNKMPDPKSLFAYYALGGLRVLERDLLSDRATDRNSDHAPPKAANSRWMIPVMDKPVCESMLSFQRTLPTHCIKGLGRLLSIGALICIALDVYGATYGGQLFELSDVLETLALILASMSALTSITEPITWQTERHRYQLETILDLRSSKTVHLDKARIVPKHYLGSLDAWSGDGELSEVTFRHCSPDVSVACNEVMKATSYVYSHTSMIKALPVKIETGSMSWCGPDPSLERVHRPSTQHKTMFSRLLVNRTRHWEFPLSMKHVPLQSVPIAHRYAPHKGQRHAGSKSRLPLPDFNFFPYQFSRVREDTKVDIDQSPPRLWIRICRKLILSSFKVGLCHKLFHSSPAKAAASPTGVVDQPRSPSSLLWTSFGQFLTTLTECVIGAIMGGLTVALFCSIINMGSKKLPTERKRTLNRVQCHSIASLLSIAIFVVFLEGEKSHLTIDGRSIAFGAILSFWTATHVLFWWEHFQLHQHLDSWHLPMPWICGAAGIVCSLLSSTEDPVTLVPCMFWMPIFGWPYVVRTFAALTSYRRHLLSFNYVE